MSGYFEMLEAELRAATTRAAVLPSPGSRRWRAWTGGLVLAGGIAVTLVVALLAVALLGHAHRTASGTAARKPASDVQLHRLLDQFGVLRRPQTPADQPPQDWQAVLVPSGARLVPGLTRLATTLSDGERVFVGVERRSIGRAGRRSSPYVLGIFITGPKSYSGSASFDPKTGYAPFPSPLGMRRNARTRAWIPTWVSVVPDGVSWVGWTFFGPSHGRYQRRLAVKASVVDNVAAAPVAGTGATDLVGVAWKGADGRTIRTYIHAGVLPGAAPISAARVTVLDVLGPNGIGSVRFGASPGDVRTAIDSLLDQPGSAYRPGGSCGLDHEITWSDQWTASGEPALTVYFRHSAFAGYQVGELGPPRYPPGGWALATTQGLRVGDPLARGRQLYGRQFATSAAQGGTWGVRVAGGLITGYAWGTPKHGDVSWQSVVATIDAGDVGCPAQSP